MKSVSVVGSLNIDHILSVKDLPSFGQTIHSTGYEIAEGGKGANQAAATGKLGTKTSMFGKVGNDDFGKMLIHSLKSANVNTNSIMIDDSTNTGCAFITVDKNGNNTIVLDSGANGKVDIEDIKNFENNIFSSDILLMQMEIPLNVNKYLIEKARQLKKTVLLNLAPAADLGNDLLNKLDYLIVNETEMEFLTKLKFTGDNLSEEIKHLRKFFFQKLIITLGPLGAAYCMQGEDYKLLPTFNVITKDKTAAGDAFIGGFLYGLANEKDIEDSVILGNASGSLSTTIKGAQKSLPDFNALNEFLHKNGYSIT